MCSTQETGFLPSDVLADADCSLTLRTGSTVRISAWRNSLASRSGSSMACAIVMALSKVRSASASRHCCLLTSVNPHTNRYRSISSRLCPCPQYSVSLWPIGLSCEIQLQYHKISKTGHYKMVALKGHHHNVCVLLHALLQVEVRLQKQDAIQWESLVSTSARSSSLVHKMALVEEASKLVLYHFLHILCIGTSQLLHSPYHTAQ